MCSNDIPYVGRVPASVVHFLKLLKSDQLSFQINAQCVILPEHAERNASDGGGGE